MPDEVKKIVENSGPIPPDAYVYTDPMHNYAHLSPKTREFIQALRPEDVVLLEQGMKLVRNAITIAGFGKWAILTILATILIVVQFGEAIEKILNWFKGTPT